MKALKEQYGIGNTYSELEILKRVLLDVLLDCWDHREIPGRVTLDTLSYADWLEESLEPISCTTELWKTFGEICFECWKFYNLPLAR
jgi:hypothetical protein